MNITEILDSYKAGELDLSEAEKLIKHNDYDEMGFAKLDTQREKRSGFPEVIFCAGKADDYLVSIYRRMVANDGCALGTRANPEQAALIMESIPEATYDPVSVSYTHLDVYKRQSPRTSMKSLSCLSTRRITAESYGLWDLLSHSISRLERLFQRLSLTDMLTQYWPETLWHPTILRVHT